MYQIIKLAGIAALICSVAACTQVKPWERGELAKREMAFEVDPMETRIKDHIYFSKEGSSSGSTVTGGGCGCN